MNIKWIKFKNYDTGLEIDKIFFNSNTTLLVGISGAGKTQILKAISYIFDLATHRTSLYASEASIAVEINNSIYEWEFTITKSEQINNYTLYFTSEKLTRDKSVIFYRDEDSTYLLNYPRVPRPKQDESLVLQYAEDINVKEFFEGMHHICPIEITDVLPSDDFRQFVLDERVLCGTPVIAKLYIIKRYFADTYINVLNAIQELFMEIQDIDVVEDITNDIYAITIKVYNKWITQKDISNGMLKSILYLVELYTVTPDTLILIDEFENSLSLNYIDALADKLFNTRNDLQFVITSHHPKVKDIVPSSHWRVIDWFCNVIKNNDYSN